MSETESDRPGAAVRYTLRVPVRTLGEEPILGLKAPAIVQLGELEVILTSAPPLLITSINGFPSEASAVEFLPRVVAALWALVVRWNIAFRASFILDRVTYAADPVAAGNNLARSFGQESGPPVDGLAGIEDVVVFPTGKRLRWLGLGEARAIVQTPASSVILASPSSLPAATPRH